MERWLLALFIFAAVAVGMAAQAWVSWLEHKRRSQALDIIEACVRAGREPPPQVYRELRAEDKPKPPWAEVVLFGALGFGFWIAFALADGDRRIAFLVIAATMTITALGCLSLALARPASKSSDDEPE